MKTLKQAIQQAHRILGNLRAQARKLEAKYNKPLPRNINAQIKALNERGSLRMAIERTEARGEKVWGAVTSYQGKYINWKDCHEIDGVKLNGTLEVISYSLWGNLPA